MGIYKCFYCENKVELEITDTEDVICMDCFDTRYYIPSIQLKKKADRIRNEYGLSFEDLINMFYRQNSRCKICNDKFDDHSVKIHVDHCHTHGEVRGLLCNNCNAGLGMFKDNFRILKSAVEYLQNYKKSRMSRDFGEIKKDDKLL